MKQFPIFYSKAKVEFTSRSGKPVLAREPYYWLWYTVEESGNKRNKKHRSMRIIFFVINCAYTVQMMYITQSTDNK